MGNVCTQFDFKPDIKKQALDMLTLWELRRLIDGSALLTFVKVWTL